MKSDQLVRFLPGRFVRVESHYAAGGRWRCGGECCHLCRLYREGRRRAAHAGKEVLAALRKLKKMDHYYWLGVVRGEEELGPRPVALATTVHLKLVEALVAAPPPARWWLRLWRWLTRWKAPSVLDWRRGRDFRFVVEHKMGYPCYNRSHFLPAESPAGTEEQIRLWSRAVMDVKELPAWDGQADPDVEFLEAWTASQVG